MERDPGKRFKYAGEVARAFERVLKLLKDAANAPAIANVQATMHSQVTLPPTFNWFNEDIVPTRKWQLKPPVITRPIPAVQDPTPHPDPVPPLPHPPPPTSQHQHQPP